MKFKFLTTLICAIVATASFSTTVYAGFVTHVGKVSRIYPSSNGNVLFKLDRSNGCEPMHSNHYYYIDINSNAGFDQSYSLLLLAAANGNEVRVSVDDALCSNSSTNASSIRYIIQDFSTD